MAGPLPVTTAGRGRLKQHYNGSAQRKSDISAYISFVQTGQHIFEDDFLHIKELVRIMNGCVNYIGHLNLGFRKWHQFTNLNDDNAAEIILNI